MSKHQMCCTIFNKISYFYILFFILIRNFEGQLRTLDYDNIINWVQRDLLQQTINESIKMQVSLVLKIEEYETREILANKSTQDWKTEWIANELGRRWSW